MVQKKILNFLFSTRLMAVLFLVFALAMAVGTFIEDSHSTAYARIYVYNAKWFEFIMLLLAINFLGNIKKYELWRKEKWLTLIFHLSFILLIVGAGVTRYISFEGMMPIQNGETSDVFYSQKTYLTTFIDGEIDGEPMRRKVDFEVLLAEGANNHKTFTTDFDGQKIEFEITDFKEDVKRTIVENPEGKRYLKLVESGSGQRDDHYLEEGQVRSLNNILFAFNKKTKGAINIYLDDEGNYTMESPFEGDYMQMATQEITDVKADSIQELKLASLYDLAGLQFVFPEKAVRGSYELVKDEDRKGKGPDAVYLTVRSNGEAENLVLMGNQGSISNFTEFTQGDLDLHVRYGSMEHKLPFSIHLNEFIAEKYPGTANNPTPSYSSFMSRVRVEDGDEKSYHDIYMNHVLDYKGYRFFQSSFMPDESGTILSVNHDRWGTLITYIGYTLLYIAMILILFVKGSRFKDLADKLRRVKNMKNKEKARITGIISLLLLFTGFNGFAQANKEAIPQNENTTARDSIVHKEEVDETFDNGILSLSTEDLNKIIKANAVPEKQAKAFGKLVIQDYQGRMKPVNTYSSELLRKLSRKETYEGLNSDQVMISMMQNPLAWYNAPIIKIKNEDEKLREVIGLDEDQKYVKFIQFFDREGNYKFIPYLEDAYRSKVKSQFQKDLIDADGQVNLLNNALEGRLLRIFPVPNDEDNKWVSAPEVLEQIEDFKPEDSLFVSKAVPYYLQTLHIGTSQTGNFTEANSVLDGIKAYQNKWGSDIMPSERHIEAEILYNKYDIFKTLFEYYLYAGLILFIFVILEIFYPRKWVYHGITAGKALVLILFLLHTAGLAVRWYISGHAPWSDAYESLIYVGWATMLFGLLFGRKSNLTVAATAFVTSIILMVAHWNWMDPSIANLEPVLDSYWIMIHTSVIVASYGPFTLGAILGLVALFLIIFTNENNVQKMKLNVKELTIINEMALTVGLVLLTIGNFLGGQWANESWGRYWSWDPKETWALISIMVYAFVIHMRLVPGLSNRFAFNWTAIIAFGSILFTYFGVNFYLSGLHSYASGDQIISYKFIGIAIAIWGVLGLLAYLKFKRYYKVRV